MPDGARRGWIAFQCDYGHQWEADVTDVPIDGRCPHGHDAVTEHYLPSAGRPMLGLESAARIVDDVTGRVEHEDEFYLVVDRQEFGEVLRSLASYPWPEAVRRLNELRGLPWADVERRWRRMGL